MTRGTLPEARAVATEEEDGALDRRFSRRMALASVSMAAEISDAELSAVGASCLLCLRTLTESKDRRKTPGYLAVGHRRPELGRTRDHKVRA
jgi:hypothetical protein